MAMSLPPSGEAGEDRYAPMAEINVTPMVDVMLVLLVIFMVTAPLLMVGVPLDLPKTQAAAITRAPTRIHTTSRWDIAATVARFLAECEWRRLHRSVFSPASIRPGTKGAIGAR